MARARQRRFAVPLALASDSQRRARLPWAVPMWERHSRAVGVPPGAAARDPVGYVALLGEITLFQNPQARGSAMEGSRGALGMGEHWACRYPAGSPTCRPTSDSEYSSRHLLRCPSCDAPGIRGRDNSELHEVEHVLLAFRNENRPSGVRFSS